MRIEVIDLLKFEKFLIRQDKDIPVNIDL